MAMRTPKQRSDEWRALRRTLITSTDLPVILGLSPYRSEGDLAREKLGGDSQAESLQMQIGAALEPVIAAEYERQHGVRLRRFHGIVRHPSIEWAAASPDFRRQGARWLVETKASVSKRWDGDDLPEDVEAQLRWALGCTGYPIGEVALLHYGTLRVFPPLEHDQKTFDDLVTIAADFRRRLADGGPFSESRDSVRRAYPHDDGTTLIADEELEQIVADLVRLRAVRDEYEVHVDAVETALRLRIASSSRVEGRGWHLSYRRAKDSVQTDWQAIADALLENVTPEARDAVIALNTSLKPGTRRMSGPHGPAFRREKGEKAA